MLSRTSHWLNKIAEVLCSVILLTMTLVVTLQVVCRYFLGASLVWSEELSRYGLVWITFLGGSIALKKRAHMALQALVDKLSPKSRKVVQIFTLFTIMGFLTIATVKGVQLAIFNLKQHSPAMGVPMGVVYSAIPAGCLLMMVHAAEQLVALLRDGPALTSGRTG
ncbi:MAG: TRAP transporter small permease [Deltaproteobacteria bacterium]|jgi:C4-dicarboxylate transporter DctQ subunit|nr:MAG: TRAP transporter small permease [Deltaproteobacteria bacterium]